MIRNRSDKLYILHFLRVRDQIFFNLFFSCQQSVLYIKERGIKFLFQYHTSNVCMVSQRMLPVALSFLSHDLSAVDFDAFALLKEGAAYNDYLGELRLFLKNPQAGIPS